MKNNNKKKEHKNKNKQIVSRNKKKEFFMSHLNSKEGFICPIAHFLNLIVSIFDNEEVFSQGNKRPDNA